MRLGGTEKGKLRRREGVGGGGGVGRAAKAVELPRRQLRVKKMGDGRRE